MEMLQIESMLTSDHDKIIKIKTAPGVKRLYSFRTLFPPDALILVIGAKNFFFYLNVIKLT